MTVTLRMDRLKAAIANLQALAQSVEIVPIGLSQESIDKLERLRLSGRDFFAVTIDLQLAMIRYGKVSLEQMIMSGRTYTASQLLQPMADGAGKHIMLRFSGGGNDVSFVPLKASTLAAKARKGQPNNIGVAAGDLKRNMQTITWKAR